MSDRVPLLLTGATGLVGTAVIAATATRPDVHLAALARREMVLPAGARLEMLVAETDEWPAAIARARPQVMVIALGTTLAAMRGDKAAFRRIDHDLVCMVAGAAKQAGTRHLIVVTSAGADRPGRNFYLSVKHEVEDTLAAMEFARLDILRPGLLRGAREGPPRRAEAIGQIIAPLIDPMLRGRFSAWRSVHARQIAAAILTLAGHDAPGHYVHSSSDIHKLARSGLPR